MSTHPMNCLHDTLEAVPQTRDIDNAERLAEIRLHRLNFLNLVIKIPQIFTIPMSFLSHSLQCQSTEGINTLYPGPYNK